MRYKLFGFQQDAANALLKKMQAMRRSYEEDRALSAVSLTAPTGAGKTVISAAVVEGLFYGNDQFSGDDQAAVLWLSDSPSLNEQTMKRFAKASDQLNPVTTMEAIGPDFSKRHRKLMPGHVYFLNRQLLSSRSKLSGGAEGGRTFYDVLRDTIEDPDIHLFLFIDEAHRGLGGTGTTEAANKTIYARLIDGKPGENPPMPNVVGISATPERFDAAMRGRRERDRKAPVQVSVSAVRDSGLIKDMIELRTPKRAADTRSQDLTQACIKLAQASKNWKAYCAQAWAKRENGSVVIPLMVVQVEDRVTGETLGNLCAQISRTLPWLDVTSCFANVFGEHEDILTPVGRIAYCSPEDVSERTEIRVLFAKDAVSTGWDCPRAEVIYSRRKRSDPTYIAQLIGRMIRTPLARRVRSMEELNTVACYLPEYDAQTVELVVEQLKEDNIPVNPGNILKNPARVSWFGNVKQELKAELAKRRDGRAGGSMPEVGEFAVHLDDPGLSDLDISFQNVDELAQAMDRIPQADSEVIRKSFEGIVTRQVSHDKPNAFLDLWDCVDIITADIDPNAVLEEEIDEEFYNNIEGEIRRHPAEFKRAFNEIKNTTMSIKRIDPLTGHAFEDREELVENNADRLVSYYKRAVNVFAGASDRIKFYINRRREVELDADTAAISRICAVAVCIEIVQAMEIWAESKIDYLLNRYGPQRYAVSEENRDRWDRIEGNTRPYVERTLSIQASVARHNKEYDPYPRHIISDREGWAYLKLNDLEKRVVWTELSRTRNVAWYRNQPRNLNASLSIPYYMNNKWENMYPDFIFFQQIADGAIVRTIVDPHGDWLGDSVAKLKGYVQYLRDYPAMFGSVQVVAEGRDGVCRYLDLTLPVVQDAIDAFEGNSARELFHGPLSRIYPIQAEKE